MKIVAFIVDPKVIRKILVHLGLWEIPSRAPPHLSSAFQEQMAYDYSFFDSLVS